MGELAFVVMVVAVTAATGFVGGRFFEKWRLYRYYRNGGR